MYQPESHYEPGHFFNRPYLYRRFVWTEQLTNRRVNDEDHPRVVVAPLGESANVVVQH
jgi:hypothetical protein